ncbi:transcriptional regulator SUPERMAN-like [Carya illinoinensis]|uniref:C2H2-type domain-containing protein n=1 Tax=Carya illinoinensis TaxID=32201 RepID=A0A8T1RPI5_CARIL|nr:transcriptional regulator SUPERMAN-like [Carya illinoinensis]KAG6668688.1 hypothetical protein CIPAW_01G188500 [Carya illinoinensis]
MESGKQGGSETSSEENDGLEQVKDDMGNRRFYECTFCKQGFTNAQALGGHMNIHRKDRAKAKQRACPSFSNKSNEDYDDIRPRYISQVSTEPANYFPVFEAQRNYHTHFQPSASDTRHPQASAFRRQSDHVVASRSQSWSTNQELLLADLSLQIGPMHVVDDGMKRAVNKADEVDLELRLGHDPY